MLAASLLLALMPGCEPHPQISVDTTSSASGVTFAITIPGQPERPTIAAFRVDACTATRGAPFEAMWLTQAPSADGQPVARITYGVPPAGWRSVQGPHPLVAGCYRAAISRAAPFEFDVQPDGRIIER